MVCGVHEILEKLREPPINCLFLDGKHQVQLLGNIMNGHMMCGSCVMVEKGVQKSMAVSAGMGTRTVVTKSLRKATLACGAATVLIDGLQVLDILQGA